MKANEQQGLSKTAILIILGAVNTILLLTAYLTDTLN